MKLSNQIRKMRFGRSKKPSIFEDAGVLAHDGNLIYPAGIMTSIVVAAVICLTSSYFLFDDFIIKRWLSGNTFARNFFVLLHLLSIYIYIWLCGLRLRWLFLAIIYGLMLAVDAAFHQITSVPPGAIDYEVWLTAIGDTTNAVQSYAREIVLNLLKVVIIGIAAHLIASRTRIFHRLNSPGIFFAVVFIHSAGSFAAIYYKGPEISAGLAPGAGFMQSTLLNLADKTLKEGHSAVVNATIVPPARIKTVILVIDESVTTKVFEKLWKEADWTGNDTWYYRAYSSANCSAASNFFIRYGVMDPKLSQNHKAGLSILEKAKRSGYKVVYYDMQNVLGTAAGVKTSSRGNYFQAAEVGAIDERVTRPQDQPYPDSWLAKDIEEKYRNAEGKTFILVNKAGAHFPYENRTLKKDWLSGESAYEAAIRINTIFFLRDLTELVRKNGDAALFYTSDHGQNYNAKITHCSGHGAAPDIEWEVPLVFIGKQLGDLMADSHPDVMLGHFHMAETLNNVLGHDDAEIPNIKQGMAANQADPNPHYGVFGSPFPIFNNPVQTKVLGNDRYGR